MSTVVVGCDRNSGNDSKVQNTVVKALEKQGHTVEKLAIGPGLFARYDWGYDGKNPKGKIGVFLIADGITAIADHFDNPNGFKYVYFIIRGDLGRPKMDSRSDFEKNPISKDWHGDCTSKSCNKLAGKNFPQMNEIIKSKCYIVFGTTSQEMADEVIKAMGGDTNSSSSNSGSSASSCKEAIQKLLTHWDGEVECRIHNDVVRIHKVREPQSNCELLLQEGVNVFSGSIKVTDVNPDCVNHLVVHWSGGTITFKDDELIKRFGDNRKDVDAVKTINKNVDKKTSKSTSKNTKTNNDNGDSEDSKDSNKTNAVIKPITKYSDALKFGNIEWNKIKRDNGHTIECQVYGSPKWRVGEWVRVILPSFNENGYMYISRASQSDDGDWTCNLALVDYPPGWGVETSEDTEESEDEGGEGEGEET